MASSYNKLPKSFPDSSYSLVEDAYYHHNDIDYKMADDESGRGKGSPPPHDHPETMPWLRAWWHILLTVFCWSVVVAAIADAVAYKVNNGYGDEIWTKHYYGVVALTLIVSTVSQLTGSILALFNPDGRMAFMPPLRVMFSYGPVLLVTAALCRIPVK